MTTLSLNPNQTSLVLITHLQVVSVLPQHCEQRGFFCHSDKTEYSIIAIAEKQRFNSGLHEKRGGKLKSWVTSESEIFH